MSFRRAAQQGDVCQSEREPDHKNSRKHNQIEPPIAVVERLKIASDRFHRSHLLGNVFRSLSKQR
jgi:hypothetical protein